MNEYMEERNEKGFTLIELLIAIVVVGILAAVAIIGIGGLTKTSGTSACKSSADAATSASSAYYANSINATPVRSPAWPTTIADLTGGGADAVYSTPAGATVGATTVKVGDWTLTMTPQGSPAGSAAPTFACS